MPTSHSPYSSARILPNIFCAFQADRFPHMIISTVITNISNPSIRPDFYAIYFRPACLSNSQLLIEEALGR
ncbi:hypothetical protein RclHR1_25270002 [Rhizophagus clarus]|uniref:Uncharacterized protein n=1 Tax=Rhizophagus clarus TaxID=94130 RepID=A0A2Z6RCQ8_9GLOM|nr:hypothetical protein RclHR1_25270002 [Rhizophagus clarus]